MNEPSEWEKKFDKQVQYDHPQSVAEALWFACDILPCTNIDRAAKTLAAEVLRLQELAGLPKTKPELPRMR